VPLAMPNSLPTGSAYSAIWSVSRRSAWLRASRIVPAG